MNFHIAAGGENFGEEFRRSKRDVVFGTTTATDEKHIHFRFQLPERFELEFTNSEGAAERPVVIHRALLGSLERFIGVYIEHVAGAFPFWLAPEQAVIVPVRNENHLEGAQAIARELTSMGLRIRVDDRNESMGYKTRQIQKGKIPFMLVIGDKELEEGTVSLRRYGEQKSEVLPLAGLKELFSELNAERVPRALRS